MTTQTTPRSGAQQQASRQNGAKSNGPTSEAGKQRSSQNATKHGLFSNRVVLANESQEIYDGTLQRYIAEWRPAGQTESDLLVQMVNAMWRMRRLQDQAKAIEDAEMFRRFEPCNATFQQVHPDIRQADAILSLIKESHSSLDYFLRAEARLDRLFRSAKKQLIDMQTMRLGHQPEIVPQPALTLPDEESSGNEPAIIGNNYTNPEIFARFSTVTSPESRPTSIECTWVDPSDNLPEDKAA